MTTGTYEVAFTIDKRGRKVACRWQRARWWRMPLAEAELAVATESATETSYYANSPEGHANWKADEE